MHGIAFTPGGTLFAGTEADGVYRSTDRGKTWTAANTGLVRPFVLSIAAYTSGIVYIGTVDDCVYRTTDNGTRGMHSPFRLPRSPS